MGEETRLLRWTHSDHEGPPNGRREGQLVAVGDGATEEVVVMRRQGHKPRDMQVATRN